MWSHVRKKCSRTVRYQSEYRKVALVAHIIYPCLFSIDTSTKPESCRPIPRNLGHRHRTLPSAGVVIDSVHDDPNFKQWLAVRMPLHVTGLREEYIGKRGGSCRLKGIVTRRISGVVFESGVDARVTFPRRRVGTH